MDGVNLIVVLFILFFGISVSGGSLLAWILFVTVLLITLIPVITLLTYGLVVGGSVVEERGWVGPRRVVDAQKIYSIKELDYALVNSYKGNLLVSKSGQELSQKIFLALAIISRFRFNPFIVVPMISFEGDFQANSFPLHPISPKIIETLLEINPNITVDSALADILPTRLRKRLGIKLTIVDQLGLWLSRILWTIATPLILFFAIVLLVTLWNSIVPSHKLY